VHNLVQNNSRISIEEIAEKIKSIAFRHLKKIWVHFEAQYTGAALAN